MVLGHKRTTESQRTVEVWTERREKGQTPDVLGGAQNGAAQRGGLVRCGVKVIEDHFL